jgi:cardiolipin synthase
MNLARGDIIEKITKTKTFNFNSEELGTCWIAKIPKPVKIEEKYERNRKYFVAGSNQALLKHLVKLINEATEIICCSSFLIQETPFTTALFKAAKRNVRVYLLTAREEELKKMDEDLSEFEKRVIPDHKKLLDSMAGNILVRTAPHFHAKFILIDPKSKNKNGFMMTCNATIDAMTGRNIEMGVSLKPEEVDSFFSQFIYGFWYEAKHQLFHKGELTEVGLPGAHVPNHKSPIHPCTIGNGITSLNSKIIEIISSANKSLILTGWSFQENHDILKAIRSQLQKGIDVTIMTRPNYYNTKALNELVNDGARLYGHDRFHVKTVIADNDQGLIMTSNFTSKGLESGFESAVEIDREDLPEYINIFKNWIDYCLWELKFENTLQTATSNVLQFNKKDPIKGLLNLSIENKSTKDLGEFKVPSIKDMESFVPDFPNIQEKTKKFKTITYSWSTVPPTLPLKAKLVNEEVEVEKPLTKEEINEYKKKNIKNIPKTKIRKVQRPITDPFPLYKTKKNRYVTVTKWKDIPKASEFANKNNAKLVLPAIKEE